MIFQSWLDITTPPSLSTLDRLSHRLQCPESPFSEIDLNIEELGSFESSSSETSVDIQELLKVDNVTSLIVFW